METILVFAQKPITNDNLTYGKLVDVDIGMPFAYMKCHTTQNNIKLSFPWQDRTPHLVECVKTGTCFHIECCACENQITSLSLVVDKEAFLTELETYGTIRGEVHIIGLIMDIWREARVPFLLKKHEDDSQEKKCDIWNNSYKLFEHQRESVKWMSLLENDCLKLLYNGNIRISSTGWFVDTENECLTNDPSVREGTIRGGILANGTGTGKTATMLYHIMSNRIENEKTMNNYNSNGNLIIVPVNLVTQWTLEIEKFCALEKLKLVKFYQSKNIKNVSMTDILEADIVLTTLHFLRTSKPYADIIENALSKVNMSGKDGRTKTAFSSWARLKDNNQPVLEAVQWKRVVVDEIHAVFENQRELRQLKQFNSKFCWGITATPDLQTENAQQLYWLLKREKAHHPNMLASLLEKCVHKTSGHFEWPKTNLNLVNLTAKERLYLQSQESELTPTEIIKLCSFVNVSDYKCSCTCETIEEELKEEKQKNIDTMMAKLKEYENGIKILEKASIELEEQITLLTEKCLEEKLDSHKTQLEVAKVSYERHSQEIVKIKQSRDIVFSKLERAKSSMEFVTDRLNILQSRNEDCSICLERKCSVIIPCGHLFCSQCIRKSYKTKQTCPECRQPFEESSIRGVTLGEMGTKMLEIVKLIETIDDPIVLFVQWKSMVRGMKSFLRGMNIKVMTLEGNVSQRATTLKDFTLGGVLLLCLEDSFAGLDLPHARHVIFSHAIVGDLRNVKVLEEQAIARCLRHGQTEKVHVYSFVVKDCDEEVIWNNTHDI